MPRKAPPLSSFAPELKAAWIKAATQTVVIRLATRGEATTLRHRLYKLRTALAEAGDPLYETAQFGTIRIVQEGPSFLLLMEPADTKYKNAISEAIGSSDLEPPPLDFELEVDDEGQN